MPRDHRNAPVSLLRSSWSIYRHTLGIVRSERTRRCRRIVERFGRMVPDTKYWDFASYLLGFVLGSGVTAACNLSIANMPIFSYMLAGVLLALIFRIATGVIFPIRHQDGFLFVRSCLLDGICPGCEYRLQGLAPHADGCVQCPECAACWKPESIGDDA